MALGCAGALLGLAAVAVFGFFFVGFLESGADAGVIALDPAASYGAGTLTYEPKHNLYVVRQLDGSFVALSDLDAANRAAPTRCRVAQVGLADPVLPRLLGQYASRMNATARGSSVLLQEACHRATYDITGLRLDADGPNLDRFETGVDGQGRLTVNVTRRTCSVRSGADEFAAAPCAK